MKAEIENILPTQNRIKSDINRAEDEYASLNFTFHWVSDVKQGEAIDVDGWTT